jgi:hypothetical protein
VGGQVVTEGDRLGQAPVRGPGHDRLGVCPGVAEERPHQALQARGDLPTGIEQPQPQVRHHQIVTAPTRVELLADLPQALGHPPLHGRVHVLVRRVEREPAGGDLGADLAQSSDQ